MDVTNMPTEGSRTTINLGFLAVGQESLIDATKTISQACTSNFWPVSPDLFPSAYVQRNCLRSGDDESGKQYPHLDSWDDESCQLRMGWGFIEYRHDDRRHRPLMYVRVREEYGEVVLMKSP